MSAPLDRDKLVKTLGMLGSAHDGEVAAAGRTADRLIRQAGLRWPDIIPPRLSPPRRSGEIETIEDAIAFVLAQAEALSEWEFNFAQSIAKQRRPLSPKQHAVLERLVIKAGEYA
jgi:hypothetical protein